MLTRTYEDGTETNGLLGRASGYSLGGAPTSASYTYDTAGRLATVSDGTDTFTYDYTPNARNLLASVTSPVHTATYSYEPGRNAMTGIENKETVGTASVVSNYAYTYNALGQRADRQQSGTAFASTNKDTFTYDYLGQVTASANDTLTGNAYQSSYAYDEIGNRTGATVDLNGSTSYTQDLLNQYTAVGANTPVYDSDGNLTSNGTWTYAWNGESRLVNASNGTTSIDFLYDYQGRLIEKDDGTNVEVYVYDGWNRIAKYVDGSHSKTYLYGLDLSGSFQGAGGVGGLLKESEYDSNSQLLTAYYSLYDANGNIMQKLDATGTAVMNVAYDPFGNIISGTLVGEYGFSTKPLIDGLDWYYYGFRYYDPVTGRWPSRDPIGERGGYNIYGMIGNDLIGEIDFLGLVVFSLVADCAEKLLLNSVYSGLNDKMSASALLNELYGEVLIGGGNIKYSQGGCKGSFKTEPFGLPGYKNSSVVDVLIDCVVDKAIGAFKKGVSDRVKRSFGDDFPSDEILDALIQQATNELEDGSAITANVEWYVWFRCDCKDGKKSIETWLNSKIEYSGSFLADTDHSFNDSIVVRHTNLSAPPKVSEDEIGLQTQVKAICNTCN